MEGTQEGWGTDKNKQTKRTQMKMNQKSEKRRIERKIKKTKEREGLAWQLRCSENS